MATADKLSYLSQTKTAIKDAIVEKGVAVSSSDTFRSYADKIRAISGGGAGGGSKLFVTNETGKEFVRGDKVLVNFSGTEGTEYSSALNLGAYWNKPFIMTDNSIIYSHSEDRKKIVTKWTPNGFISSTYTNFTMHVDNRYPYVFQDNVLKQTAINSAKCNFQDYNNMTFVTSRHWSLKDDLKLDLETGILYNEDESLSYDTGIGRQYSKKITIQIYDNTVIIHQTDSILFIDVSNFPECSKRTTPVPLTTTMPFGMTGIDEGSFLIFSNGNTFYFYKYTGKDFKPYLNIVVRDSESCQYINIGEGVFCFIRSDNTPVVYMVEGESLIKKQIPIEIINKIESVVTGLYRNNICFVCNRDMTHFSWTYSTGQYNHYGVASHTGNGVKIYIAEPEQSNYTDAYSFTGYITGNVDNLGRYEAEMVLPETVDVKIVTNVDVANNEIIFEGME